MAGNRTGATTNGTTTQQYSYDAARAATLGVDPLLASTGMAAQQACAGT